MKNIEHNPPNRQFQVSDVLAVVALRDGVAYTHTNLFSSRRIASMASLLNHMHGGHRAIVAELDSMAAYIPGAAQSLIKQYPMTIAAAKRVEERFNTGDHRYVEAELLSSAERMVSGGKCTVDKIGQEKPAFTRKSAKVTAGRG